LGTRPHKQKLVYATLWVYGGRRGEVVTSVAFLNFRSFFTSTEYHAEPGLTLTTPTTCFGDS